MTLQLLNCFESVLGGSSWCIVLQGAAAFSAGWLLPCSPDAGMARGQVWPTGPQVHGPDLLSQFVCHGSAALALLGLI